MTNSQKKSTLGNQLGKSQEIKILKLGQKEIVQLYNNKTFGNAFPLSSFLFFNKENSA